MSLEKLLYNPERYRDGPNFQATNIVYPVEFERQRYIVKQPRPFFVSVPINAYYTLQDQFLFGTRQLASPWLCLEIEAKKLRHLRGVGAPRLVYFDGDTLVREYIPGLSFRDLTSDQQRQQTLEGALAALEQIHAQNVVVGNAHVKNTLASPERVCWLDFDGVFDESDLVKSKAIDLLRFIYSTYTVTRNLWTTLYAAELVVQQYSNGEVRQRLPALASQQNAGVGLWFSTRMPWGGRLQHDLRKALQG